MTHYSEEMNRLKESLLAMASHAESAVARAMRALVDRDDALARQVQEDDNILDQYEVEIDDIAIHLLTKAPLATELRLITVAMKVSQNLERVGDEAVTITRRAIDLGTEPQLKPYVDLPRMATMAIEMLRDAITAFINRDPEKARAVVPRDKDVDNLNRQLHRELELHGRASVKYRPLPQFDGNLQSHRAHRRPRRQYCRGGRLSLRGERHPSYRRQNQRL